MTPEQLETAIIAEAERQALQNYGVSPSTSYPKHVARAAIGFVRSDWRPEPPVETLEERIKKEAAVLCQRFRDRECYESWVNIHRAEAAAEAKVVVPENVLIALNAVTYSDYPESWAGVVKKWINTLTKEEG
jgi:hypothetical protein